MAPQFERVGPTRYLWRLNLSSFVPLATRGRRNLSAVVPLATCGASTSAYPYVPLPPVTPQLSPFPSTRHLCRLNLLPFVVPPASCGALT